MFTSSTATSGISSMAFQGSLSRFPALFSSMKRDKVVKVGYTLSALISVTNPNNMSAAKTQTTFKVARDVFGFGNVLGGVLNGIIDLTTKVIPTILLSLKDTNLVVKLDPSSKKWIDKSQNRKKLIESHEGITKKANISYFENPFSYAASTAQKVTALFEKIGEWIGCATYTIGFGAMRPISTLNKNCGVSCGKDSKAFASQFPLVMAVNHIGGLVQHSFSMIRSSLTHSYWKNEISSHELFEKESVNNTSEKSPEINVSTTRSIRAPRAAVEMRVKRVYAQSMVKSAFGLGEKAIETIVDINTWSTTLGRSKVLPPVAAVGLTFAASILGLASAWFSTYKEPKVGE